MNILQSCRKKFWKRRWLWTGLAFSAVLWVLEALRDSIVLDQGSFVKCLLLPDGLRLWMRLATIAILFLFGAYIQVLIHSGKRTRKRLKDSQGELEKRIDQRTGELTRAVARLEEEAEERKRVETDLRRVNRALKTLSEGNKALVRASREEDLLQDVCRILVQHGQYRLAWVGYVDGEDQAIVPMTSASRDIRSEGMLRRWPLDNPQSNMAARAVHSNRAVIEQVESSRQDPLVVEALKEGLASIVCIPLAGENRVFGMLGICTSDSSDFDTDELALLEETAHDLAFGIMVLRDKSDQKRMKDELLKSEIKYRTLTENINAGIFRNTPGPNGKFLEANPFLVRLFGFEIREEFLKIKVSDLYQNPEERLHFNRKMKANGFVKNEVLRLKRKDGSLIWASVTAVAVSDSQGNPGYYDGVVEDITERIQALEALCESEERYRMIAENTTDVIWMLDMDLKPIYVSPSVERQLGYTPEEITGKTFRQLLSPESYRTGRNAFTRSMIRGRQSQSEGPVRLDLEMIRKDGSLVSTECIGTLILNDAGKPLGVHGVSRDVTERKKAEALLRETSSRLETVINAIPDAVCVKDSSLRNILFNKAFECLAGKPGELLIGKTDEEIFPSCFAENGRQSDLEVLNTGNAVRSDEQILKDREESRYFETIKVPLTDAAGKIVGLVGVSRDVTERRQMQHEIEKRKKYLEFVLNETPDAIVTLNANHRIIEWNHGALRVFGHARSEVLGKDLDDVICNPETREETSRLTKMVMNGHRVPPLETVRYRKDGSPVDVIVAAAPIRARGELQGIVAVYTDITERKRAEEELRRLNRSLKTLSEVNISLVRDQEETGLLEDVSHILTTVGGYRFAWVGYTNGQNGNLSIISHAGFNGTVSSPSDVVWDGLAEKNDPVKKTIKTGGLSIVRGRLLAAGEDSETLHKQDAAGTLSGIYLPLKDKDRLFGILSIVSPDAEAFDRQEVSLLQEMANDLAFGITVLRSRRAHEAAVREKQFMKEQLLHAQKMEAVGILAGGIAHDFNNLLTAILGSADMAMMEVNPKTGVFNDLKEIVRASKRAAELTKQLLLFSRKQPMRFYPINLNITIQNLIKMLQRLIGEDITIRTHMERNLRQVRADRGTLEQVIMNLAVNARDAMTGGGRLEFTTRNVTLEKPCSRNGESRSGKFVCLSVSDTGIGIPAEIMNHIFEPFFSTKGVGKGTGLGLSVVYGIVKQHEGWIEVETEPDKGTVFHIYFPALSEMKEVQMQEINYESIQGDGKRILIVEDEERVREFAISGLGRSGYEVFAAADAREAVKIFNAEKGNFSLILSDVVLPDRSGLDLVDEFLRHNPRLGVLFSSGYTDYQTRWPSIEERGFRFLEKPYALADLLHAIKDMAS